MGDVKGEAAAKVMGLGSGSVKGAKLGLVEVEAGGWQWPSVVLVASKLGCS